MKSFEVGELGASFCLSQKSFSSVKKCQFKKVIFVYAVTNPTLTPRWWSIVPNLMLVRSVVSEELEHGDRKKELRFIV